MCHSCALAFSSARNQPPSDHTISRPPEFHERPPGTPQNEPSQLENRRDPSHPVMPRSKSPKEELTLVQANDPGGPTGFSVYLWGK